MASCLVPDFPAVMVALEHLKELDQLLLEERVPFAPEASLQLKELTAAITNLESDRRNAHERLEVETIENSKLRHQINNIRDRMSQEIMADLEAARASNAEEMEQLQKELKTVSQLREATEEKQEVLLNLNQELLPHGEREKAEHDKVMAALNNQISLKYALQMQLDHTREQSDELKSCMAAVRQDKATLEQNMMLERDTFNATRANISTELNQTVEKVKQQKQAVRRSKRELERVNSKKQEVHDHLEKLMSDVTKLESNLQKLTATRCQYNKLLEGETQMHQDFKNQREKVKTELCELGEAFSLKVQNLKQRIAAVEGEIEEGQALRLLCQDQLTQVSEMFMQQHDEECKVRAEHSQALKQLEESRLQLDQRIASKVKYNKEIREMDKKLRELIEAKTVNRRVFEKNQEKLCESVDAEKRNIQHLEEERSRLRGLMEEVKRTQEVHVAKMTAVISSARRRYEELRQEEAALHQWQPKSTDVDLLVSHVTQCVEEYREMEFNAQLKIDQCMGETESILRSNDEKQREVQEKKEALEEVEAKWKEEQSCHQKLEMLISEQRKKRSELEVSIQELKEETKSLLKPKEEMKAKLEETRASHLDLLTRQMSELRAVELRVYDSRVKLEQVIVENSRLHLCIRQMTDDLSRVRANKDRCRRQSHQLYQDRLAMFEILQEAWRKDLVVTEENQRSDGVLLLCMNTLLNQLKTRRQETEQADMLLNRKMLDFNKRLGNNTATEQRK